MPQQPSSSARLLAPVALAVVAIAFFTIVFTTGSGGGGGNEGGASTSSHHKKKHGKGASGHKRVYRVKTGDTLAKIADKTGVSVDKLQELNPQLDPQALVSGQKIKLKE